MRSGGSISQDFHVARNDALMQVTDAVANGKCSLTIGILGGVGLIEDRRQRKCRVSFWALEESCRL
jgi:hypothetical protein